MFIQIFKKFYVVNRSLTVHHCNNRRLPLDQARDIRKDKWILNQTNDMNASYTKTLNKQISTIVSKQVTRLNSPSVQ